MGLAVVSLAVFELSLLVSLSSRGVASLGVFALGHVPLVVLSLYDDVKALPLPLDSLAVAFAWSFEIAYVFAFVSPHPTTAKELTVLFVSWFLLVFAGVEARNTEDVEGDRKAGKVTLAVMLGQRRAKLLAVVLKAGGVALLSMAAGTVLVSVLVVLHLLSLRFFRTLEVDCRDRTRPTVSPENVRPQYRERDEQPATEQSGVTK